MSFIATKTIWAESRSQHEPLRGSFTSLEIVLVEFPELLWLSSSSGDTDTAVVKVKGTPIEAQRSIKSLQYVATIRSHDMNEFVVTCFAAWDMAHARIHSIDYREG